MRRQIVDSHIHFACAERLAELQAYRKELSIAKLGIVSLPSDRRVNFNPEVLFSKLKLPEACYGFASFDYSQLWRGGKGELDLGSQVRAAATVGFDGIKMWEGKPTFQQRLGIRLDDPIFAPAFDAAAEREMPIVLHVADPKQFWSAETGNETRVGWGSSRAGQATGDRYPREVPSVAPLPTYESLQEQTETILRRHRQCTFIFPHLLFRTDDLQAFAEFLAANPNAYLDLSPGLYYYGDLHRSREEARDFFSRFSERILFGTDAMWFCPSIGELPVGTLAENLARAQFLLAFLESEQELDNPFEFTRKAIPRIRGLGLPHDTLANLLGGTCESLFAPQPRPIDRTAARAYLRDHRRSLALLEELSSRQAEGRTTGPPGVGKLGAFDPRFFDELAAVEAEVNA